MIWGKLTKFSPFFDSLTLTMQALAPLIEAVLSNDAICVVGSEPAINKEKELFDTVLPLISC